MPCWLGFAIWLGPKCVWASETISGYHSLSPTLLRMGHQLIESDFIRIDVAVSTRVYVFDVYSLLAGIFLGSTWSCASSVDSDFPVGQALISSVVERH